MNTNAPVASTPTIIGSPLIVEKSNPLQSDEKEVHEKDSDVISVATYDTSISDAK